MKAEKTKGSALNTVLPAFLICAITSFVLRFLQVYKYIDVETGFFTQSSLVNTIAYIQIFGTCIFFFVYSFITQRNKTLEVFGQKSKVLAAVTYIFAAVMLIDTVNVFASSIKSMNSNTEVNYMVTEQQSTFKSMMSDGSLPGVFQCVFGVFTVVYFLSVATSFAKGSKNAAERKILALAPVGWVAFRMVHLFVSKISFVKVSDLFFELVMLACMILFFMSFAQSASGVYNTGTSWKIASFGLPAALIAFALQMTRLILSVIGSEKYINPNHTFSLVDLVFSIFCVAVVFSVYESRNEQTKSVEIEEGRKPDTEIR